MQCECPIAGYCQRHKVRKPSGWHKLCQTKDAYFQAWEQGRGPGQEQKPDEKKEERRKRVAEAIIRKERLISWLKLLQSAEDAGVGDTTKRLLGQKKKPKPSVASDARDALSYLLRTCSCSGKEAVKMLNEKWPY